MEQIQNTNFNKTFLTPESWLKPQETSIKNDQFINNSTPKKVTFSTLNGTQDTNLNNNLFQKLKKSVPEENNESNEKYIEQKSILLPDVNQENTLRNLLTNNNVIPNIPIIPNQELVKQINEMSLKIDNLVELVNNLTNLMKIHLNKNLDNETNNMLNNEEING